MSGSKVVYFHQVSAQCVPGKAPQFLNIVLGVLILTSGMGSAFGSTSAPLSRVSCGVSAYQVAGTDACSVYLTAKTSKRTYVYLTSNNGAVSVPSAVTVKTGASSTGFNATISAVTAAQTATITATANGIVKTYSIALSPSTMGTPAISLSSASLPFGSVSLGTAVSRSVTLTSSGTAPLTINSDAISGAGFSLLGGNSFPATLSPGQAIVVSVQFDPASAGTVTGQLTFSTSAGSRSVSLSGAGNAAAALSFNATSIAFGNVYLNTPAEQAITLSSTGTAPVTVNSVTITGTGFTESGASFPVTLNPGQSATVNVQFDPASAGVFTGQLTIASSASTDSLPMTGTGQAHQVRLSWTAPAGSTDPVTGYNIYRASSGTNGLQRVNGTADMQTVYVDTAVQSGSTYDYLVKSVDANGVESAASNTTTASIP